MKNVVCVFAHPNLPTIRKKELLESARILGVKKVYFCKEILSMLSKLPKEEHFQVLTK